MEAWHSLEDTGFHGYEVSSFGNIRNLKFQRLVRLSYNQSGLCKVGLIASHSGAQVTRSVAPLVANAFLPDPPNERFNTPINVNGDRTNNRADNLMWRPRWFAVKYHAQFHNNRRGYTIPIVEINTGEEFATSWEASIKYGLIDLDVAISMRNRTYVFPTGQEFHVIS